MERFTIAYLPISLTPVEVLAFLVDPSKQLTLTMGRANCHHKDQFNKKTGRELAESRMKPYEFKLNSIYSQDSAVIARFESVMTIDEAGALIDQNKETITGFHIKIYRDSGKSRIQFDIGD